MSLRDWFAEKKQKTRLNADGVNRKLSDDELCSIWVQCYSCNATLPRKAMEHNQRVCMECDYHFRIGGSARLEQLFCHKDDAFIELNANLGPADPLTFTDTQPYRERQAGARKKSKLTEAVVTGITTLHRVPEATDDPNEAVVAEAETFALGIMDFDYLGGSMGSVVGEKLTCLAECALKYDLPLVIFSSSGGARMQEGTLSLMQMVKTGTVLAKMHDAGLLYISVLTEPTFGGVTASFGTLGDVIIAEKGARIGFAGRRVIEQTIRQKLPNDFQTAGYLMKYGQVDRVVHRHGLRHELLELIRLHRIASSKNPKPVTQGQLLDFEVNPSPFLLAPAAEPVPV